MNRSVVLKSLGIAAILVTGIVHAVLTREAYGDVPYKGILFGANALGAIVAAAGILRDRDWGWILGVAVAGGALAAYILSRTIGLPSLPAEPDAWLEPAGVASVIAEAVYLVTAFVYWSRRRRPQ
ncbi:MAG: hypothetical protein JWO56_1102 [Acidobacteria bacterium]|nr:hypothetical protein [Acidobacteriota bacterium]